MQRNKNSIFDTCYYFWAIMTYTMTEKYWDITVTECSVTVKKSYFYIYFLCNKIYCCTLGKFIIAAARKTKLAVHAVNSGLKAPFLPNAKLICMNTR